MRTGLPSLPSQTILLIGGFLFTVLPAPVVANGDLPQRPNVLLIVSDDQRPDTIRASGNERIHTPHLDRLMAGGTAFTRATCANPLCVTSRAEILTGCTGFRNGVLPPVNKPDLTLTTWQQAMKEAGYRTGWVGKWHIAGRPSTRGVEQCFGLFGSGRASREPQFDYAGREVTGYRGWMFQTDDRKLFPERGVGLTADISAKFADAAIEFLKQPDERPFFLQVNFTAAHDPLLLPPGYEKKYSAEQMAVPENFVPQHPFDHGNFDGRDERLFARPRTPEEVRRELAAYYAVISHLDEQIGRILKMLDKTGRGDTLVVFTSDHGLAIGSHGLRGKQNMYEHTIGVPLIMAGPGIPAGKRSPAACYLRDLYPTVCDLCHIPIPESVQGKSLAAVIAGKADAVYPFTVGYFSNTQRMIRTDRWKYIWYPQAGREQLFDLQQDPYEQHSLDKSPRQAGRMKELREQLLSWLRDHNDPLLQQQ
jgi:arylsulfatase A-like enzyme